MSPDSPNAPRSWPAEKPRPAPVITTARTAGSRASSSACCRSACSVRVNALSLSGRLSVIVWTAPSRLTSASAIAEPLRLAHAPGVEPEPHELAGARWQVARRIPARELQPLLGRALEGWDREGPSAASYSELPFPGIPLIINLGSPWRVDDTRL